MRVRYTVAICILLFPCLTACTVFRTSEIAKIVLLAPFEGRYREIGYNALYAARLALSDSDAETIELLAIDDGGTIESAIQRIEAINQDLAIKAVVALGIFSTSEETQTVLGSVPMVIVGHWHTTPTLENVVMLTNPEITSVITWEGDVTALSDNSSNVVGSEILALEQAALLTDNADNMQIVSSASLPDANFRERYLSSAEFAPEPNLLAPLTYDATHIVIQAIQSNTPISQIEYEGIHGQFSFADGYWIEAPINHYVYDDDRLILSDSE